MRDYKKIRAYQYADELCILIYKVSGKFPREELYGLTSQLRRASVSVAANIIEGASRQTFKDYSHFRYITRGSLAETQYLISLAARLEDMSLSEYEKLSVQAGETA